MNNDSQHSLNSLLHSEGFVLAILTVTVYAAFLVREMGYASHFGVPIELISISHVGLIIAVKAILFGVMSYLAKANLVWFFAPIGENLIIFSIRYTIGVGLIYGFALYPFLQTDLSWWWLITPILLLALMLFGWPLITQRKIQGYENKLSEQVRIEQESDNIYQIFFGKLDMTLYITISLVIAILVFAYGDGRRDGIEKEEFFVLEANPNWLMFRVYGDIMISVKFDKKAHQLSNQIRITKLSEGEGLILRNTNIGRLASPEVPAKKQKQPAKKGGPKA